MSQRSKNLDYSRIYKRHPILHKITILHDKEEKEIIQKKKSALMRCLGLYAYGIEVQKEKLLNEKNKENKVIELLNSKYIDQLKNLRNNYLDKFVRDMQEKNKNNNDTDLEKYINDLKQLLFDYEFWFENKKPRVKRRKENI